MKMPVVFCKHFDTPTLFNKWSEQYGVLKEQIVSIVPCFSSTPFGNMGDFYVFYTAVEPYEDE